METWQLILITICLSLLFSLFLLPTISKPPTAADHKPKLPPGPRTFPVIGRLLLFRKSSWELELFLRNLRDQYGPIISVHFNRPAIFIASRSLAHEALIQKGAVFADRPRALPMDKFITSNQHNISSAVYGPTWRLLRRNLTSEIFHPSRVKSYGPARKWVLDILVNRLKSESHQPHSHGGVRVVDHFQYAMFCLLVLMCFGDRLDENQIKQIEAVQRRMLLSLSRFNILNIWPEKISKILLKKRWDELFEIRKQQGDVLVPLIRARQKATKNDEFVLSYADTLLELQLSDEDKDKRKLTEDEMVSLCSEFLNAGTDTTFTALQWIMANIVKYPQIQDKIFAEIKEVVGGTVDDEVKEEVLHKLPYVKAVILEGLRRHPPVHSLLPHAVTQDVVLGGYAVPKNGSVNLMVAEMGWDPEVWEDPMAFKPERFLSGGGGEGFDLTGTREIKMMPFGAGRRICPGSSLALLHLEYFVANLVWKFEWRGVEGDDVDLSEKQEFAVVMKNPLQVNLFPRVK